MGKYRAYESYKDSEVEWLGEIPEHWEAIPLKFLVSTRKGIAFKSIDFTNSGSKVIRASDIKNYTILESDLFLDNSFKNEYPKAILKKNEIVISTVGSMPDVKKSAVGQIGIVPENLDQSLLNQNTVIFTADNHLKLCNKFLFYCLISRRYRAHLDIHAHGTANQASLNIVDMLDFLSFIPPLEEQKAIARFLDYKTNQIDALIAKKEALLKKLDEKRTALISHAVTKGLDANIPMKDSGIEWLGEIPEHWKPVKVRYYSKFVTSGSRGWSQYFSDNGSVFLRIANVSRNSIELKLDDIQRVIPPSNTEGERAKVLSGDLIISITADLGSVAIIPSNFEKGYVSQHLALVRPIHSKVHSRWIAYQIFAITGKKQLLSSGYGGTKIQLSLTDIKDLWITLPEKKEQKEIAEYLDRKTAEIDSQKAKIQQAIDLLKEYRTALITSAVTGKIDVRQVPIPQQQI